MYFEVEQAAFKTIANLSCLANLCAVSFQSDLGAIHWCCLLRDVYSVQLDRSSPCATTGWFSPGYYSRKFPTTYLRKIESRWTGSKLWINPDWESVISSSIICMCALVAYLHILTMILQRSSKGG